MRWAQRQRLLFIGEHLLEHGRINRSDLMGRFGISPAQVAKDFRAYEQHQPGVLFYDASAKTYVPKALGPATASPAERQGPGPGMNPNPKAPL